MAKSFTYVYVPADCSVALEERSMTVPEGKEMECLLDELKDHFVSATLAHSASGAGVSTADQISVLKQQVSC